MLHRGKTVVMEAKRGHYSEAADRKPAFLRTCLSSLSGVWVISVIWRRLVLQRIQVHLVMTQEYIYMTGKDDAGKNMKTICCR